MSLHLVERLRIGRGKWTDLRLLLKPFVKLSPYNEISLLRMKLCPALLQYPFDREEKLGVVADLKESVCLNLLLRLFRHVLVLFNASAGIML